MNADFHYRQSAILNLIWISKLSQGLYYITALAIMQNSQDNGINQLQMPAGRPFCILFLQNLSWVILQSSDSDD